MTRLRTIPVAQIAPSPDNTRLFDRTDTEETVSLDELAASIRELGLQQPPKVRPSGDKKKPWILIYGERRLRAVRDILKLDTITVLVDDDLTNDAASAATVVENLQRRDLHPMDEARGIAILRQQGTSVKDIARRLGRREDWIKERLTLCDLPTEAQDLYRRAERMTLHQALALHDYTHGGRDNKGFPPLIVALAKGMAEGSNPNGGLTVIAGTLPELAVSIQHAYHDGGGRWGGNYFDTRSICTKCPFAAYRPGYYDGVGHCLMPLHYQELQRKGKEKYDVAQTTAAAASSSSALTGVVMGSAGWTPEPQKTAAQKGKETRQRHKDQTAAYYPNVQAIERAIDMIPAVDTVDVAVLCAYTLTTDHVERQAVEHVMTRHALKSFPRPGSTPGRAEIERLRLFDGVQLVRYTLEALLLTQAMRARDYDPGKTPADPVLAMYLPGQAVPTRTATGVVAPHGDTGSDDDEDLVDVQGEQVSNDEDEGPHD